MSQNSPPPPHILRIATARIGFDRHAPRADERVLDITVKSAAGIGRLMAPDWDAVLAFKAGRSDWEQYSQRYHALLRERYASRARLFHALLDELAAARHCLVLTCYCNVGPDARHCHRFLMADILAKIARRRGFETRLCGELPPRPAPQPAPQPTLPGFDA